MFTWGIRGSRMSASVIRNCLAPSAERNTPGANSQYPGRSQRSAPVRIPCTVAAGFGMTGALLAIRRAVAAPPPGVIAPIAKNARDSIFSAVVLFGSATVTAVATASLAVSAASSPDHTIGSATRMIGGKRPVGSVRPDGLPRT